ncbi:hypothetical protein B0H17DRAFT_1147025 [Mycena rosella]|uniref:Uncharacterized protein n=1 Tax=Mycena rosella TaxID=1033263 RepID=A0AAD7CMP9_MYCRO|nr:hypothetical protein B0H17DRAFT_1147025 [Mycena rosella]
MDSGKNSSGFKLMLPASSTYNLGACRTSSPIVPLGYAEEGLKAFTEENERYGASTGCRRDVLNVRTTRDDVEASLRLRAEGGRPSSAAFEKERAADDALFAGRHGDGADPASTISSQARRDARIENVSPIVPQSFAVGPSLASRPVLHNKGKGESGPALATRTSANVTILANHIVTSQMKHSSLALDVSNTIQHLEGKLAHIAAGGNLSGGTVPVDTASLQRMEAHVDWIKKELERSQRDLSRISSAVALHDNTNDSSSHDIVAIICDLADVAKQVTNESGDAVNALEARLDSLLETNKDLRARNTELEGKVNDLEFKASTVSVRHRDLKRQILEVRKNVVEIQISLNGNTEVTTGGGGCPLNLAATRKRGAPADAETSSSKRPKSIPCEVGSKNCYIHWVEMFPIGTKVQGTPMKIVSQMLSVVFPRAAYELPTVFVEKNKGNTGILIGFEKQQDGATLVRKWAAAPDRPEELSNITITFVASPTNVPSMRNSVASGSGMTAREKEIASLTAGNY